MTNSKPRRPRQRRPARPVFVFSEMNHELRPEDLARIIVRAGLEQARRDAVAKRGDVANVEEEGDG